MSFHLYITAADCTVLLSAAATINWHQFHTDALRPNSSHIYTEHLHVSEGAAAHRDQVKSTRCD